MAGTAAGLRFLKRAKHYHKDLGVSGFFHRGQTLKKHTYLTRVFACVIVSTPTFGGSDRGAKLHIGGVTSRWGTFFSWAGSL